MSCIKRRNKLLARVKHRIIKLTAPNKIARFDKIIPVGCHCNITYLLQHLNLKKETTLFEWFQSQTLSAINDTLTKIDWLNPNTDIVRAVTDKTIQLGNIDVNSMHYKEEEFKPIFLRRAERFYNTIQNNDRILFIRLNIDYFKTTLEEIEQFMSIIESMKLNNANIHKMKFMLISTVVNKEDFVPIQHDCVIHRYILRSEVNDPIMKNDINIQEKLRKFLIEAGYNINDIKKVEWNDRSEV